MMSHRLKDLRWALENDKSFQISFNSSAMCQTLETLTFVRFFFFIDINMSFTRQTLVTFEPHRVHITFFSIQKITHTHTHAYNVGMRRTHIHRLRIARASPSSSSSSGAKSIEVRFVRTRTQRQLSNKLFM